jgi:hypothetical protein
MDLIQWASRWAVPAQALEELRAVWAKDLPETAYEDANLAGMSEAAVTQRGRLEESRRGTRMWRNNSGALMDERGRLVRFGLMNDSAQMNKLIKSPDYIGVYPRLITLQDVGHVVGQFVAREFKEGNWHYTGQGREVAQKAGIDLINSLGGDASFWNGARYEP